MGQVQVFCFVASYAVALVLEVTRLFFKSGVRGAAMVAFAASGLVAHTWFLVDEATRDKLIGAPLSNWFDWYLAAAWGLAVAYVYLTLAQPRVPIGLFLLPLVLALIAVAYSFQDAPAFSNAAAESLWGRVHGLSLLGGSVVVIGGFAAGLMYLVHAAQLKRKSPPAAVLRLPSLEWLERINARSLPLAALLLGVGVLSGAVLNLVKQRRNLELLPWSDPVVWSSAALFAWMVAASTFSFLYRPARQGRKVAYLTVASFGFLVLVLVMALFFTAHGGAASPQAMPGHLVRGGGP